MKQEFEYMNDSLEIMPGFYDSILYDYGMEVEENRCIKQNCKDNGTEFVEHEIKDFKGFMNEVCKRIVDNLMEPMVTGDKELCDSVSFKEVHSPREYNFTTDKVVCTLNIDLGLLERRILSEPGCRDGFNGYLRRYYTSRSGWCSFVSNNVEEYFKEREYPGVMIDYWILTKIYETPDVVAAIEGKRDFTDYECDMMDIAKDCIYEYMKPVTEE